MSLTVSGLQKKKYDLEVQILGLLENFEGETGVKIQDVTLSTVDTGMCNGKIETVLSDVSVEIKI